MLLKMKAKGAAIMSFLFNRNRIVEKDYREKQYFSDRPSGLSFKTVCGSSLLVVMAALFSANLFQSLTQVSVVTTFF